ncbi:HTH-type transcriptional regulator [Phycisphaerales bacterium]|nr:HTH-type transcriptional regulator [Phycisphaerales bacterium]
MSLDRVFKALASEVRREILDALREGPKTTGELVMRFPDLSRFAVMQHLKVLWRARLVVSKKQGRERHNFLNPVPIRQVYERWVTKYEGLWAGALTELKRRAEAACARRGDEVHPTSPGVSLRRETRGGRT